MALFAIADLHLSFSQPKPMDIFGIHWLRHYEKIQESWLRQVTPQDTVLIPGDISWAMTLEEALPDLQWIDRLPGQKIFIRGNHDYWWSSLTKLSKISETMGFVQNNFVPYGEYAICGTRGWTCPNGNRFTPEDQKIYLRELHRLENSLLQAQRAGMEKKIVMLHYPPTNEQMERSGFTELCEAHQVTTVVYGHLHGEDSYAMGLQGIHRGVEYHLVSCDYLNFEVKKLMG